MFSIGYTAGLSEVFEEINTYDKISDVYFSIPNAYTSSARATGFNEKMFYELRKIQSKGIKLHLVLNGATYNEDVYSDDGLNNIINIIDTLGVEMLTINNTAVMRSHQFQELNKKIVIKNSVNNKLKTLDDVIQYVSFFKFKHIMLDRSLNRNKDELEKIIQYCKNNDITTTLLVNEGCIANCPYKQFCDDALSNHDLTKNNNFSVLTCGSDFESDKSLTLKSPFIVPGYINKYRDMGINYFKIACRGKPLEDVRSRLKAYMFDNKNISLSVALDTNPHYIYKTVNAYVLDEYNFFEHTVNCKNKCNECNYCDTLLEKFLKEEK
jgi:collagenase-like PrtC family protease